MERPQKITFAQMRASGVRGLLIFCSGYQCSHLKKVSDDQWPDEVRLSDLEPRFVCHACRLGSCPNRNRAGHRRRAVRGRHGLPQDGCVKFKEDRTFADVDAAVRKLQIANAIDADHAPTPCLPYRKK
jgi:hypothetical protein